MTSATRASTVFVFRTNRGGGGGEMLWTLKSPGRKTGTARLIYDIRDSFDVSYRAMAVPCHALFGMYVRYILYICVIFTFFVHTHNVCQYI